MIPVAVCILLLSLVSAGNAEVKNPSLCPKDVQDPTGRYTLETRKACYRFVFTDKLNYWGSRSRCERSGGKLASITTAKDNYLITKKLQTLGIRNKLWIGMFTSTRNSKDGSREFVWDDDSEVTFTSWANSEGSDLSKMLCVLMDSSDDNRGRWFDTSCYCKKAQCPGYICKYVPAPPTEVPVNPPKVADKPAKEATKPPKKVDTPPKDIDSEKEVDAPKDVPDPAPKKDVEEPVVPEMVVTDKCHFDCDWDCGMDGFITENKCQTCHCVNPDDEQRNLMADAAKKLKEQEEETKN